MPVGDKTRYYFLSLPIFLLTVLLRIDMSLATIIYRTKNRTITWTRTWNKGQVIYVYENNGHKLEVICDGMISVRKDNKLLEVDQDLRLNLCQALSEQYLQQYEQDIDLSDML